MKRFGEIAIGELFFYAKKKMKKLDAYNAVTVVYKGKEHFMFFKHNLVEEFVDPVINNEKKNNSSKFDLPLLNIVNKNSKFGESSMILDGFYVPPYIPLQIFSCKKDNYEKDILQLQSTGSRGIINSKALQDELDRSFL